uniref:Uncharacterized protein n=1 Tax=Meloidogyne hapla TaxID=6305 RepID=A0A1I8B2M2_MELHA
MDTMQFLLAYSKNFQQLFSCMRFMSDNDKRDQLITIIEKIKGGKGKIMLGLNKVEDFLKLLEKFEKQTVKFIEMKSSVEKDVDTEVRVNQQMIDLKVAIKSGYLRYIYIDELCRSLETIYKESEYKGYFSDICTIAEDKINPIKEIIQANDKQPKDKQIKNKEEIISAKDKEQEKLKFIFPQHNEIMNEEFIAKEKAYKHKEELIAAENKAKKRKEIRLSKNNEAKKKDESTSASTSAKDNEDIEVMKKDKEENKEEINLKREDKNENGNAKIILRKDNDKENKEEAKEDKNEDEHGKISSAKDNDENKD